MTIIIRAIVLIISTAFTVSNADQLLQEDTFDKLYHSDIYSINNTIFDTAESSNGNAMRKLKVADIENNTAQTSTNNSGFLNHKKLSSRAKYSVENSISDRFSATVSGVKPTQINSKVSDHGANLELWQTGTQDILSYQNWGTNIYTRNINNVLQAAGVNLTGISVPSWMVSLNQQQLYATAISPLHILSSAHWHPSIGQSLYFIDESNHSVFRQVVSEQQIIDQNGGITDLWLAKLSSALPEQIKPFKVLSSNYKSILQNIQSGIPAWICQGGVILQSSLWTATNVDDLAGYQPNPSKGFDVSFTRHTGAYSGWNPITQGGSGSPMFIVINNEPVLISVLHYMRGIEALGGPSVADLTVQINSAMATLQGGRSPYQLTAMHFRK